MFSKVFIYGLTFGSAAAALQFTYYSNALYQDPKQALLTILIGFAIYILSIVLCIKSIVRENSEITIKKTIASGISVAIIIGVSMSLIGWIIESFYPSIIDNIVTYQKSISKNGFTQNDVIQYKKMFKIKTTLPMFMFFSLCIGLVVSSVMVLVYQKRIIK